ncbi:MAG: SRPBCC family protein [Vicinamibacterales bacterium]
MSIRFEHQEPIAALPDRVFEAIDDLPRTAQWLPPCVSLEKVGTGPNAVGDALRYVYEQGGRRNEMSGSIVARTPGARLHCVYADRAFEVSVDLRVAPGPGGSVTTHIIEMTPKTFAGRLMAPLIRMGLRKQTREAAANLKGLLENPRPA